MLVKKSKIGRSIAWLALCSAAASATFMILLSCFDTIEHEYLHWQLSGLFLLTIYTSATLQAIEFRYLKSEYSGAYRISYAIKFYTLLAIAIGGVIMIFLMYAYYTPFTRRLSALCEWQMAFTFQIYLFSMVFDTCHIIRLGRRRMELDSVWPSDKYYDVEYFKITMDSKEC
jgi:Frag1/DRAM/Sfk1 family